MVWSPRIRSGQSLIELLVAMALSAIILPALLTGLIVSREARPQTIQRTEASALLREAVESVRLIRDSGWVNISLNGTYHPEASGDTWTLISGTETISGYTRTVVISDAFRDSSGNLVDTGGSIDPSTKLITVTVSWTTPRDSSVTSAFYLTRFRDNLTYTQTTVADFDSGEHTGTTTQNSAGGEVILGSGGQGNWCEPELTIGSLDLPKSGVANALTAIEGKAFAGTGDNASGVSFASVNISDTDPPVASVNGTFDGYKTNDIFGEEDYAYLATDNNSKEIEIIDLSTNPLSESGYFNAPGNGNGNSVVVSGTTGYMASGNILYSFDLASKSGSRPQLGSITLAGVGTEIAVVGTYAYVSVNSSTQLQIIDVANPSSMFIVGSASVAGTGGNDLYVNTTATRAYLVTGASSSQREFFVIDITSKSGSQSVLGSYDTNGMNPKAVTVVTGNKAIAVGIGGQEYQVIDFSNESALVSCGGLNIDTGINGIASIIETDGDAYSYIITGDASSEFRAIAGGPGAQFSTYGVYESAHFDPGFSTAYNRLEFTVNEANSTQVELQVAVADAVSGSCDGANFVFVGPDGSSATFFTEAGAIPSDNDGQGYENPGRCFKYQAFLSTSELTQTPQLNDVTVNFSP